MRNSIETRRLQIINPFAFYTNNIIIIVTKDKKLLSTALILSIVTIVYNLGEGIVSVFFGVQDETLALFGFGVDSFVEVISGLGIAHMILRIKRHGIESRGSFERTALKITGTAFFLLTAGLVTGSVIRVIIQAEPETTMVGIIISSISIATMYFLYRAKLSVGRKLSSDPIISDAACTKTCFYLSFLLLASSLLYELFCIPYIDAAGSLGIAYYAFKEGREAFEKARESD
ncbi:MAG: cation transporter [Spirochaetia bacterium]